MFSLVYNPLKLAILYTVSMQSSPEWLNQTWFSLQRDFPCFYQPLWRRVQDIQDFNNGEMTMYFIGVTTTTLKRKVLTFKSRATMGKRERVIGKISIKMFDILWLYCMWVTETGRNSNGKCCFIHLQIKQMATERRWELEREARERSESDRVQMERSLLEKDTHTAGRSPVKLSQRVPERFNRSVEREKHTIRKVLFFPLL